MKNLLQIYAVVITLGMTILLFVSFNQTKGDDPSTDTKGNSPNVAAANGAWTLPQVITSMDLTKDYDFAGEKLPIKNFDAVERLDRELSVNSYWHSNTLMNLKASYRYFPIIEPILAKYGVPDDFKYIAVAESNFRNETSPAGAKGIWQFLESTGEYYGLEVNSEVDERFHLEKSTEAACKYLLDYYEQFGNWTLCAAAYNMGGPRVKKFLAEQKVNNYYDLNLNSETSRYVFRIIAMKEIMGNPMAFGFYVKPEDIYAPLKYSIVTTEDPITSLTDFALSHNTTYRMLKVYNPWLITSNLSNKAGKTYELKIPLGQ